MALAGNILRDDQRRPGIDCGLDIVTGHATVPGAGRHGPGVRICQGYLPIRSVCQSPIHGLQMLDVLPDTAITPGQMRDLIGAGSAVLLSVNPDHLIEAAFDVRLRMGDPAGDLALGEVAVAGIHRPEFATVNGNAHPLQHAPCGHGQRARTPGQPD